MNRFPDETKSSANAMDMFVNKLNPFFFAGKMISFAKETGMSASKSTASANNVMVISHATESSAGKTTSSAERMKLFANACKSSASLLKLSAGKIGRFFINPLCPLLNLNRENHNGYPKFKEPFLDGEDGMVMK